MSARGVFVAGTDTGVGKTRIATALLRGWAGRGLRVAGMKPVAAGALVSDGLLKNEDVEALAAAANVEVPWGWVNPYCFEPPIAPHIAALRVGARIDLADIRAAFEALCLRADRVVVEGAGGLLVPLNESQDMAHLVRALQLPVVLVVGLRLGCLSHALLTAEVVMARGLTLAGWVANGIDPGMAEIDANLATLRQRIAAPCLGYMPHGASGTELDWPALEAIFSS